MNKKALYWLPVIGQAWMLGEWIAKRVRARRAAKRRGQRPRVNPRNVRKGIDDTQDLIDSGRDAYRKTRRK